jgi:small-conductance mechanosensitive channel
MQSMTKLIRRLSVAIAFVFALTAIAGAQQPQSAQPPAEARELLRLLEDPTVRTWLQAEMASAEEPKSTRETAEESLVGAVSGRLAEVRAHVAGLLAAVPRIPAETSNAATRTSAELSGWSPLTLLLMVLALAVVGIVCEAIFSRLTVGPRRTLTEAPTSEPRSSAFVQALRFAFGLGQVISFAIGSIGAFLLFRWPAPLEKAVLALLVAVLVIRITYALGVFLLAPPNRGLPIQRQDVRLLPMSDLAAAFWQRRLLAFVGYFTVGYAIVSLMPSYGFSPQVRFIAAYTLGIGLLAIAIETTWRRPHASGDGDAGQVRRSRAFDWAVTAYLCLLWLVWVVGGPRPFWIGVYIGFLATAMRLVGKVARGIAGRSVTDSGVASVRAVAIERGARAGFLVVAALWLAYVSGIDFVSLGDETTLAMRLARGAAGAVVILLVADFVWQIARASIDRNLSAAADAEGLDAQELARRGRLRTLLPIFRNVLFIVVAVTAILMALSALGVQIGPLIAGAGVVGVAIGFGAQTLVKDIISGVFYMLDDAFRVGEYIQSGSYKGTVESFSLRSVKLRHHRGPVFTVPFGELGAVQNMSRDWVIDKFMITVEYDTDLPKAKKIVKAVGAQLKEDPELGPNILETVKMQGVEQFGEYGIQLRFKVMTKPGQVTTVRRAAYALIKKAFDENGIHFAFPTVQVAGGGEDAAPAAMQQVVENLKDKSVAAE